MVFEFPEQLRKSMQERYKLLELKGGDPNKFRGTIRVDAKLIAPLRREAKSGDITWISDARKEVGSLGEYPGALQYFISGLPFCHMAHYSERASVMDLSLESVEITVRAHYDTRPGGYFDEILYETRIVSPEPEDKIKGLVNLAEHDCYVTNTLSRAAKLQGTIFLNGSKIMRTFHYKG